MPLREVTAWLRQRRWTRYPVVRQYDRIDCGPAALLSVLRYHGGDASLVSIRDLAQTDAQGTTMLALVRAAEALGYRARGAMGTYEQLKEEQLPCIAHVVLDGRRAHWVVVYRIDARGVLLGDPASGLVRLRREKFQEIWRQQSVILLSPTGPLWHAPVPQWWQWLGAYLRPEQTWLYQAVFLGIVYTGLGLLTSVFIMLVIDRFIPEADYGRIVFIGIAVLVLQVFRATTAFLRQRFLIELNKRVSIGLAQDFLGRIFRLPARFFDSRKIGDITARLSDSVRIQTTVVQILGSGIIDGLVIGGSLAALFMISSDLGWVGLAAVPVYAAILLSSRRGIREAQNETVKAYAQVESSYIDSLGGIEDIRAFNVASVFADMTTNLYSRFQGNVEALGKTQVRAVWQAEVAGGLVVMGTLVTGASLVVAGRLALGEMMASYSLLTMMLPSTMRLIEANIALQGASIAATRLLDLLLVEPEPKPGPRPFHMAHRLQIRAGGFTWPRGGRLLKSIELTLERGRLTALWGHTGSGKSTLVKILQRSYALTEGSLWVDDEPADEISLTEWRRNVAVVPQAVKVFNGTLADNILIGRTLQDPVQLAEYVARLGFGTFFDRYPAGLSTLVGEEGRQLSSGERQVVGLLRALWDSPAVLVMDEGMNAIDWSTAEMVFRLLRLYAREHAVLLISHNPATVRRADLLYVLSDGSIIDEGRPERPLEDLIAPARVTGQPVAHSIA